MSAGDGALRFGVLGEVRAEVDGVEVDLGGPQPRALVAALVVAAGRTVSDDALVEAVWGQDPPPSATGTLQAYVSRLRRALGPSGAVVERRGAGYRLAVDAGSLDWQHFEALAEQGRAALADDPARARDLLSEAEALWRGPALAGLADRPFATGTAVRLEERREAARSDRLEAELRLGRHEAVLGELEQAVRDRPLDESRWARLALARYRAGQQDRALEAVADARRALADALGADPGTALRELELQLLRQDPALAAPVAAAAPQPVVPAQRTAASPLVGRDAELAALLSALEDSTVAARFAVVEGEPGIGKTRLVEEVIRTAADRGALVLWGRTYEGGAAPAFWPWLPVLRALRDSGAGSVEPALAALLEARGTAAPSSLYEAFDAVVLALRRTGRHVVVALDDLQWADTASLELLGYLATHLRDEPVLLLATVRDALPEPPPALLHLLATLARARGSRRLQLRGLSGEATRALVTAAVGAGGDVPRHVQERSAGNPFFATELARLLVEGASPEAVPAGVRDVVRQRLAVLPAATTELLQLCAVAGRQSTSPSSRWPPADRSATCSPPSSRRSARDC